MIPFNKPFIIGKELEYIADAVQSGHLSGDGKYTKKCSHWMEEKFNAKKVLLTHSCTGALEIAAILANIIPGDEVILPSYTFVSTVNAFVLRGAIPVWCEIREDTLNIDETKIEALITTKTRAIVPVHYAGVGCEMDSIMKIAKQHNIVVIEDAAQAVGSTYKGKFLGTIGHLGCFSFHETKNVISGEGGALLVNNPLYIERAEIIREKGTNRSNFFRGLVDKYTWVDYGSSFLPSELVTAFLFAQLEESDIINSKRLSIWNYYYKGLSKLSDSGKLRLPVIPSSCKHNAHMFYIILPSAKKRDSLMNSLKKNGVHTVFHYIPLHAAPMGQILQPKVPNLPITVNLASRLLRLPMYFELSEKEQRKIVSLICKLIS